MFLFENQLVERKSVRKEKKKRPTKRLSTQTLPHSSKTLQTPLRKHHTIISTVFFSGRDKSYGGQFSYFVINFFFFFFFRWLFRF